MSKLGEEIEKIAIEHSKHIIHEGGEIEIACLAVGNEEWDGEVAKNVVELQEFVPGGEIYPIRKLCNMSDITNRELQDICNRNDFWYYADPWLTEHDWKDAGLDEIKEDVPEEREDR